MATTASSSLDAARAVAPLIREHADIIESERRLPEPVVNALMTAGIFKLLAPRTLGGGEADPVTVCRVIEELSEADGSTGWCAMLGISYGLFGGLVPERAAQEIFADPGAIVAGSFRPSGTARTTEDGYVVSGRWPFGSGIMHSTWAIGGCRIFDDDKPRRTPTGAPETRVLLFPIREVKIIDTWHVAGLRGTGSHDYAVTDVVVPIHRGFSFTEEPVHPGALYSLPAVALFTALIASVALGIARHALEALKELAANKASARSQIVLREQAQIQAEIGEAEGLLRAGRAFLYETVNTVWDVALRGRRLTWEQRGLLWLSSTQAVTQALQAVDLMFRAGGASSIYVTSPLERCLRDIRTAAQHHVVTPGNYEVVGQLYLGLDVAGTFWGRDYRGDA